MKNDNSAKRLVELPKAILALCFIFFCQSSFSISITSYLETQIIPSVGSGWVSVSYDNSYSSAPVIACTYNLPSAASEPVVVRLRNVTASGFDVRAQVPIDQSTATPSNVYCTISAEGTYTSPIKYKAGKVVSDDVGKSPANTENITPNDISFSNPVVIGQVMTTDTANKFAAFWSCDCARRQDPPDSSGVCVGKHVGRGNSQADFTETLGYILAEEGHYFLPDFDVRIERGADTIAGVGNNPPYSYDLSLNYTYATATQAAEDGGDGSWAVFYGANPISRVLNLAVEEDTAGNTSNRAHTTEEVDYWVIEPVVRNNYADIIINEVMYQEGGSQPSEFVELYVNESGVTRGFVLASQDGVAENIYLPEFTATAGDYIVIIMGNGSDTYIDGVYTYYTNTNNTRFLTNNADDVVLLAPSDTDSTALNGSGTVYAIPADYVSYGTAGSIDSVPVSVAGVTVPWDASNNTNLDGAGAGVSISLTPNAIDFDTSLCWEQTASGQVSGLCTGYLPTRDTDVGAGLNSRGQSNTTFPIISLQKTVAVIYDPININSNPKSIPGSVEQYTLVAQNSGNGVADNNSIVITDVIPQDTKLCVANAAECEIANFIDGSPSSNLSLNQIQYSNNGGSSFGYIPSPDIDGADFNVTHIRIVTNGAFAAQTGTTAPNFSIQFSIVLE